MDLVITFYIRVPAILISLINLPFNICGSVVVVVVVQNYFYDREYNIMSSICIFINVRIHPTELIECGEEEEVYQLSPAPVAMSIGE